MKIFSLPQQETGGRGGQRRSEETRRRRTIIYNKSQCYFFVSVYQVRYGSIFVLGLLFSKNNKCKIEKIRN